MRKISLVGVSVIILLLPLACGDEKVELVNDADKISYSLGNRIGSELDVQLKEGNFEVNPAAFAQGIEDVVTGKDIMLTEADINNYLNMAIFQQEEMSREARNNLSDSNTYLLRNAQEEGVIELPSGLQYEVIKEGTGATPTLNDSVKVHYHGTFANTVVFDSSVERGEPVVFKVSEVIRGWTEALQLMKESAKWKLFIPPDLAYGVEGIPGVIPPNKLLIFEVELLEIIK